MESNLAAFLLVVATFGNCMFVQATGTLGSTEDTAAKILLMEKTIDGLRTQTQETANILEVVLPQLLDCKAKDDVMLQKIKLLENNLQEQFVNQVQQLKNQTTRVGALEKRATDTELRLSNLEITDKSLSSSLQSQISLAYQKLHTFSLKQGILETSIKNQDKALKTLKDASTTAKATQGLLERQIQNTESKQSILYQKVANQATQLVTLDNKATRNYKQFTWNQAYDKNAMTIKTMSFNKKTAHSGLSLSFYGVLRSYAPFGFVCNRWWFELNGAECTNPAKIECLIESRNAHNYFSSSVVSGICNGIPAGTVNIAFKVGVCGVHTTDSLGDAHTGFGNLANHIVIEEIGI